MTASTPSRAQLPLPKWDAKFSLFFMQKLVDSRYLLGEDTAAGAFDHLRIHAALFIEQAVSSSKSELSPAEEEKLEQVWARLLLYHEQKRWPTCLLTSPRDMTALKVSLASIGAYLMFRAKRRLRDLDFGLDIFALVISATIECFAEKMFDESRILVNLAENHILQRMNDENIYHSTGDPTEEQVLKFNRCSAELFWCRVFMRYNDGKRDEIMELLQSMKENPVELEPLHTEGLSQICHNVSLELIEKRLYEEAIVWLKFTYTFAKKSYNAEDCLETAVSLLAACYLELDCIENSGQVLEILDRAETNLVNMELRLQAMVAASWDSNLIAEHVIKYFKLKHEETTDGAAIKHAADQVFSLLEEAGQHSTLAHLTRLVPWSRARCTENEIETEGWAIHVRHLCAKYAARICLSANDRGRFFEIVAEVSTWEFESDDESIPELAAEAEKIAVELHNEERDLDACLRWYDVIIKFVNHREIDWMVVWNAMACALDTAHPSGSQKARELARLIPQFDDWSDPFPLSVRLKLSLLELKLDDTEKALFDMGENSCEMNWEAVEKTVANVSVVLRNADKSEELLTLLEQAEKSCTVPTLKGMLLRFVLRFQMELLRNEAWKDGDSKEYLLNGILDTLGRAREALSDDGPVLTEIRAWFARTAWNLGRLGGKTSAYFRHHLFKFSHLLFVTGPERETALIQAVQAALGAECKRITHVRLLQSSLALIEQHDRSAGESSPLVKALEFHALCLLKDWRSAEQLAEEWRADGRYGPDFFESVACIALEARRARIRETDAEGRVFTRPRAPPRERARLATAAAKCLRRALDLSTPRGIGPTSAYCRCIVAALFDELPISTEQFELLDGLVGLICAPSHPFASIRWIFTRIWNATLLCPDRGFRRRVLRWLERCLELSPHADRLTALFGQQFALAAA